MTEKSVKKCEFLEKNENLIFYGPSGRGKTYLAIAIGIQACDLGKKGRFYKVSHLINDLLEAQESKEI